MNAATEGSEVATLLTFQLGGETPQLLPLHDSSLPLVTTVLILTLQPSTAEIDLGATNGEAAEAVSFLPATAVSVGQSLLELASSDAGEGGDEEVPNEAKGPDLAVAPGASPWQPFFMGLDEALDQLRRDSLDQFLSRDEPAPAAAQPPPGRDEPAPDRARPPQAPTEPSGRGQGDPAPPAMRGTVGTGPNPSPEATQGRLIDAAIRSLWAEESPPVRTSLSPTSGPWTSDGPLPAEIAPGAAIALETEPAQGREGPFLSSTGRGFESSTDFAVSLAIAALVAGRIDPPGTRQCTRLRLKGLDGGGPEGRFWPGDPD